MPKIPKYSHHKASGQARVWINGKSHYLGPYGSPESRERYARLLAESARAEAEGAIPPAGAGRPNSAESPRPVRLVGELVLAYQKHADRYYRRADGTATGEARNIQDSLRPLLDLYRSLPIGDFGPLCLKTVRESMVSAGLTRKSINQRVGRIVAAFRWAVSEEYLEASVWESLRAVQPLRAGRSPALEAPPVKPIDDASMDAVKPFVARQVWAMIELQRLTGMRPGEVVRLNWADIDTSTTPWVYRPSHHKTVHRGKDREIPLGPRARAVLGGFPLLEQNPADPIFRPCDARSERFAALRSRRKSKVQPSQVDRSKPGERRPGLAYSVHSYRAAITRACERAGIPAWHPHQIRHAVATELRRRLGVEVARVALGHNSLAATEIYAERDRDSLRAVFEDFG